MEVLVPPSMECFAIAFCLARNIAYNFVMFDTQHFQQMMVSLRSLSAMELRFPRIIRPFRRQIHTILGFQPLFFPSFLA